MKTTAAVLTMIPCFLAVAFSAAEPFVPNFADIPTVEATSVHLHAVGVETFVTEAQKASISPPRIHSKYWVDTMPATAFSKRWRNAFDEKSQAQSFLKEFFAVFGVDAVTAATFEHRVKFADGSQGYADCLWPGRILVEMKSRGKDLDAAFQQAMEYVRSLAAKNAEVAKNGEPLRSLPQKQSAHAHLDALVDKAYGLSPSATDAERVAHLFKLYAEKVRECE